MDNTTRVVIQKLVKALEYCTYESNGAHFCAFYDDYALKPVKEAPEAAKTFLEGY